MAELGQAGEQVTMTLEACRKSGIRTFIIYPNSDQGYKKIVETIDKARSSDVIVLSNVEREAYLQLLANFCVGWKLLEWDIGSTIFSYTRY